MRRRFLECNMPTLLIHQHHGIATVTLNRPEAKNAFNDIMFHELRQAFAHFDSNVRVVVLTGAKDTFCAGADLQWMLNQGAQDQKSNRKNAADMAEIFRLFDELPWPLIGRINGAAFGGGVGLVACCDLVVAVDTARFALSEVRLGLVPAVISPFVLRKIGLSQARRYFVSGEIFNAETAQSIGLVHKVTHENSLDAAVEHWTTTLQKNGPQAMVAAKKLLRELPHLNTNQQTDYTVDVIAQLRASPEAQEGLKAFLEKRPAKW